MGAVGKVNESKKASEAVGRLFFTTPAMDLHHHVARPRGGRSSRKARATTRWPGSARCPLWPCWWWPSTWPPAHGRRRARAGRFPALKMSADIISQMQEQYITVNPTHPPTHPPRPPSKYQQLGFTLWEAQKCPAQRQKLDFGVFWEAKKPNFLKEFGQETPPSGFFFLRIRDGGKQEKQK